MSGAKDRVLPVLEAKSVKHRLMDKRNIYTKDGIHSL